MSKTIPASGLKKELEKVTVRAFLPSAKKQTIELGDLAWPARLHALERKYSNE